MGRAKKGGLCWKAIEGEFEGVLMAFFGLMKMMISGWNLVEEV